MQPKEKLTAFQRWEMASFDAARPTQEPARPAGEPLSESLETIKEAARKEAYAQGFQEGYAHGVQEGQASGHAEVLAHAAPALEQMNALSSHFSQELERTAQTTQHALLDLALALAEAIVHTRIELVPESILPIVQHAIEQLPTLNATGTLFLNPDDLHFLQAHPERLPEQKQWRLLADAHLERGDCRIDTAHNFIDARIAPQWQALREQLEAAWKK